MKVLKYSLIGLSAVALSAWLWTLTRTAQTDRDWLEPFTHMPEFRQTETGYALSHLSTWDYDHIGPQQKTWTDIDVHPENLREVWFFLEPFPANDRFGHTFLSFVFDDCENTPQTLSISVEARREKGEPYSAFKGLFRNYELIYLWSEEKDILSRIAIHLDHPLYAYKMNLTPEQMQTIFEHFVSRTNALRHTPRFYNTARSNCTNELAKAANEAFPDALPWHISWMMTGRSPEWLHKRGHIAADAAEPFDRLKAKADIQTLVKTYRKLPPDTFSATWRTKYGQ